LMLNIVVATCSKRDCDFGRFSENARILKRLPLARKATPWPLPSH
jgi:hypothetical protein